MLSNGQAGDETLFKAGGGQIAYTPLLIVMMIMAGHGLSAHINLPRLRFDEACGEAEKKTLTAPFQAGQADHFTGPDGYGTVPETGPSTDGGYSIEDKDLRTWFCF